MNARRFRYESFGGIVQLERPAALVFVDQQKARELGHADDARWSTSPSHLSAPLEAHLQLTNRCDAGCTGCYTSATTSGLPHEAGLAEWKLAIDALAEQGVFHLALGGGESALLPWLGDIVDHARSRGLVPNLTTSGLYDDTTLQRLVAIAPRFGQINVSLDGVGATYAKVRGEQLAKDGFARADRALVALRAVHRDVGINAVLTRDSFDDLSSLFAYARKRRVTQLELLRYKPSGRGRKAYEQKRLRDDQAERLLPTVLKLSLRHLTRVRLDCSLVPFIAHHAPAPRLLRWLSIYGCAGGDHLVAAKADGRLTACSFAPPVEAHVAELGAYWERDDAFGAFRAWKQNPAPCDTCEYLSLCRGGCRVVSLHVTGSLAAPDPECPRVRRHHATLPAQRRPDTHHLPVLA